MLRGATEGGRRGQSEALGMMLLIAMTLFATMTILVVGTTVLDASERRSCIESAEHAMTKFDSQVALVGLEGSHSTTANLPTCKGASIDVDGDAGWMRIDVYDIDPDSNTVSFNYTLMNRSLGAVSYRGSGTVVAYQGGGVWKRTQSGSTMVSPPEFHYRGTTLTLPLLTIGNSPPVSEDLVITKNATVPQYPVDGDPARTNPLEGAVLNVTVHSDYYRAWGAFFVERTGGTASYDHANETVKLRLQTPPQRKTLSNAMASTSTSAMIIEGAGGSSFTDSYNSSSGSYGLETGTVATVGGVDMSGGAEVRGDLVSGGGTVEMSGSSTQVTGNISHAGTFEKGSASVGGWIAANGSVDDVPSIGGIIDRKVDNLSVNNDNGISAIDDTNDVLQNCDVNCTLPAGQYYLDEINLDDDDTLKLDLEDGDVVVAVENDITLKNATVQVTNVSGGTAKIYMDGNQLDVTNGATVDIVNDSSPNLWIFGPPDTEATIKNSGTKFVGVIYAPESDSQSGSVDVTSSGAVYGAVVGGQTSLKSGGSIHFDQALRGQQPLASEQFVVVTYLHISVNSVTIRDR